MLLACLLLLVLVAWMREQSMRGEPRQRAAELFLQVKSLPEDRRPAVLSDAGRSDAELHQEVLRLLRAGDLPTPFRALSDELGALQREMRPSIFGAPMEDAPCPKAAVGRRVGPYKLLEQIGEGGFGVVYLAEQEHPVRRNVALKEIKLGMDSRQVIARFEGERQALALMDHPNIAKVLDAGTTDAGRPYFVMELVRGVPITTYCDEHRLSTRQRLALFVRVCHAVQHAHQKGVIHRDLKPSNVMVTLHDGAPVPKVIDFGVAKATSRRLTEFTLFTEFRQFVGTPEYMSPEQAELGGLDVDTRSDVYSLGVLLYELLTGTTPFDAKELRFKGYAEMQRLIRELDPPRPSTRVSTLADAMLAEAASRRRTEPRRLGASMRGELDWVVMKAIEKDRTRRYQTASGFAADVQRYLDDEPVHACPQSKAYRFRKLLRRNRGAFVLATVTVLLVLLSVATLAATNFLIRHEKERAETAQGLAEQREDQIREGLERLKSANALLERGRWYARWNQWDDAHAAFTRSVELRPDHATAWIERGELFALLGLWDLARTDFARDFELRDPDTTTRWYRHALLMLTLGDLDGYRKLRDRMCERFRGTMDPSFAADLIRTCALASGPDDNLVQLVERAQLDARTYPASPYLNHLYILGLAQHRAGQHEEAVLRLRESLTPGPDRAPRALAYPVLAMAHHRLGQTFEAREALRAATEAMDHWTWARCGGGEESHWTTHRGATAAWPIPWPDWLECLLYLREAKLLIEGALPAEDARLRVLRARAFAGIGQHDVAEVEYAAALLQLGADVPQVRLEARRSAAYGAASRGQWAKAAAEFAGATDLAPDDADLWDLRAVALLAAGDVSAYRQTCLAMLERFERTLGPPRSARAVVAACVLRADALPDMGRLVPVAELAGPLFLSAAPTRATAMYRAGRYAESVGAFEEGARICRPRAWDWAFVAMARHRLGQVDEARRCLAAAERWIDQANRRKDDDLSRTLPAWGSWADRVEYPLVLREAQAVLSQAPGKTGAAPARD